MFCLCYQSNWFYALPYCSTVPLFLFYATVVEQYKSSTIEQAPRGGAGPCQNAAQCHTYCPTWCWPDDQGLYYYMYAKNITSTHIANCHSMCFWLLVVFAGFLLMTDFLLFVWNLDPIFWRCGRSNLAVLRLPLPEGQPTEVPVL